MSATATTVPVNPELLAVLRDLGEDPVRALGEAAVLELFRRDDISHGRAVQILGMDLLTFVRLASNRGISVIALSRTGGLPSSMPARSLR